MHTASFFSGILLVLVSHCLKPGNVLLATRDIDNLDFLGFSQSQDPHITASPARSSSAANTVRAIIHTRRARLYDPSLDFTHTYRLLLVDAISF